MNLVSCLVRMHNAMLRLCQQTCLKEEETKMTLVPTVDMEGCVGSVTGNPFILRTLTASVHKLVRWLLLTYSNKPFQTHFQCYKLIQN